MTTAIEQAVKYDVPAETLGQEVISQGKALRRTQTQFTTAIAVVKPRERKEIIRACEEEATLAGDEFYYSWTIKTKQGPRLVEGLSVQAALALARNWGNCAVPVQVDEEKDAYIFTASFLDLETGFNFQRVFRQRKGQNIGEGYGERAEDIIFQIGQSKAIRNAILNALPSWLTSKVMAKAKENVIEKIRKMGIATARQKALDFFARYNVSVQRIEEKLGKNMKGWTEEDLALLQGAMNALLTGQESAESLFPDKTEEAKTQTEGKAEALKEKLSQAKGVANGESPESDPAPEGGAPPSLTTGDSPNTSQEAPEVDLKTAGIMDKIKQGLEATGTDETQFMQACVHKFAVLLPAWGEEEWKRAEHALNLLADKKYKIVVKNGQPQFVLERRG